MYASSKIQDGAISAYLLSQKIIPPNRPSGVGKLNYAGGYLFCPKAGLYKYMFDEDVTSLYPSIIMTLNIGRETIVGKIIDENDRNNRLGLNDLKEKDGEEEVIIMNPNKKSDNERRVSIEKLIQMVEKNNWSVAANGTFFKTDKKSVLSIILDKWFKEREIYKNRMKHCYQKGDTEGGAKNHLLQYTMKILLNSLYGATALPSFRYGLPESILSESITLSGWRIIQESALAANRHMNKVLRNEIELKI